MDKCEICGGSLWIQALKQVNYGKNTWCIPRKGTNEYEVVKRAMDNIKNPKKRKLKLEPVVVEKPKPVVVEKPKPKPVVIPKILPADFSKKISAIQKKFKTYSSSHKKMNEFYAKLNEYLTSKSSTRAYKKFIKDNPNFDADFIDKIVSSQKRMDFYSTPEECLNSKPIRNSIRRASYILEPTAGLGNIVHFIDKFKNKKAQVAINELNESFIPALEKFFPKFDIYNESFFEFETQNTFDLIICNPPFSIGKDSKAYLDFLIKCIYMLNISETEHRERVLIFICPPIIQNDRTWKVGEFNGFDFSQVVKNIPFERMNRMSKLLQDIELDKKEYKAFQGGESYDDIDKLIPYQSEWLGSCKGFGGTNIQAEIYKFIMF